MGVHSDSCSIQSIVLPVCWDIRMQFNVSLKGRVSVETDWALSIGLGFWSPLSLTFVVQIHLYGEHLALHLISSLPLSRWHCGFCRHVLLYAFLSTD